MKNDLVVCRCMLRTSAVFRQSLSMTSILSPCLQEKSLQFVQTSCQDYESSECDKVNSRYSQERNANKLPTDCKIYHHHNKNELWCFRVLTCSCQASASLQNNAKADPYLAINTFCSFAMHVCVFDQKLPTLTASRSTDH